MIEDHADWILDVAFSPDGKRLGCARAATETSKVFDVAQEGVAGHVPRSRPERSTAVAFSPRRRKLGRQRRRRGATQIRVWSADDDAKQVRQAGGFGGPVFKLQYTPDGKSLIACASDKTVRRRINPGNGFDLARTFQGHTDWVYTFAFSADGKTLASGSWDGEVRLWNLTDAKLERAIVAAPGFEVRPAK